MHLNPQKRETSRQFLVVLLVVFGFLLSDVGMAQDWDPNVQPVRLVSKTDQAYVLDNVRWGSNFDGVSFATIFKRTTIRPDLVKEVRVCTEDFPPKCIAAHMTLAFIFKNQDGVMAADGSRDAGLVISVTNRLRRGEAATSLMKAFFPYRSKDPWPLIFEVGTLTDRAQSSVIMMGHTVRQYSLNIAQENMVKMLRAGLEMSLVDRSREYYQVLQNNCVTGAYKIMMAGLGEQAFPEFWMVKGRLVGYQCSLPKFTGGYLRKRNLVKAEPVPLDASRPLIEIPTDSGTFQIDLSRMPGWDNATKDIIPFAEGVKQYANTMDSLDEIRVLLDNLTAGNAAYPAYQDFEFRLQDQVEEIIGGMINLVQKNPSGTMNYYTKCLSMTKRQSDPVFSPLTKQFRQVLQFKISRQGANQTELQTLLRRLDDFK